MKSYSALLIVLWLPLTFTAGHDRSPTVGGDELPTQRLPMQLGMGGFEEKAMAEQQNGGYYRPVPPQQPYRRACGTIATDICPVPVAIPPGATGAQLYTMAKTAEANQRKGEAMWLLQQSAELDYAPAEGAMGMNYLRGVGTPRDTQKGIDLLERAARQGSANAEMQLGVTFEEGANNVRVDEPRAIAYFKAAAAQHGSLAEYRLGLDYEIGRGVPHDRAAALVYLRRAAADGQSMAGTTASFLARSRAPQYHSVEELDDAMAPRVSATRPANRSTAACGPALEGVFRADVYTQYCTSHPGCPYTKNNVSYTCPAAPF